ncbi:hypothetical protein DSO57_1031880 [Entomophthora muscae]|uniref:Uncharacterized protein n=1 Tax=Entomophthora muscae TaxID=34485 RepID=A0ACC2TN87_9FUNG|nr:hypothetical protein DSO57_1031880 [Entomophthora muscae]
MLKAVYAFACFLYTTLADDGLCKDGPERVLDESGMSKFDFGYKVVPETKQVHGMAASRTNYTSIDGVIICDNGTEDEAIKGYSDELVVKQTMTSDIDKWECDLAPSPQYRHFHTDFNLCTPRWLRGQCVEWADGRYFQLTGVHAFEANASEWASLAAKSEDWRVSSEPVFPSIAVFSPSGGHSKHSGHVAVVEDVLRNGRFCISHWNAPKAKVLVTTILHNSPKISFIYSTKADTLFEI